MMQQLHSCNNDSDQILETQRYITLLKYFSTFTNPNEEEALSVWKSLYTIKPIPKVNGFEAGVYTGIDDIIEYLNLSRPNPDFNTYLDTTLVAPFTKNSCYTANRLTWDPRFFFA